MAQIPKYVPIKHQDQTYTIEGSDIIIPDAQLHPYIFIFWGVCARGAKKAKVNSVDPALRFEGLIPMAEDWHTRLNFGGTNVPSPV